MYGVWLRWSAAEEETLDGLRSISQKIVERLAEVCRIEYSQTGTTKVKGIRSWCNEIFSQSCSRSSGARCFGERGVVCQTEETIGDPADKRQNQWHAG